MNQYLVDSPYTPFTIKNQFKAIYNGKVYIGKVDQDPLNTSQQIQVYVVNESGVNVPVSQPIMLNAGGYLVYNGQVSKFVTLEPYSLVVLNSVDAEMWRVNDISKVDPDNITASTIPTSDSGSVQDFIDEVEKSITNITTDLDVVNHEIATSEYNIEVLTSKTTLHDAEINALQSGQGSSVFGYATKSDMDLDLVPANGSIAYVTNDPTPVNNSTYRKVGATGTGAWTKSASDLASQSYSLSTKNAGIENATTMRTRAGKNLLNKNDINHVDGKYLDAAGGFLLNVDYATTGFIELLQNEKLYCNTATSGAYPAYYDKDFNWISAGTQSSRSLIQSGLIKYGRLSYNKTTNTGLEQIEVGVSSTEYESYYEEVGIGVVEKRVTTIEQQLDDILVGQNLINPDEAIAAQYINASGVVTLQGDPFYDYTSGFIAIKEGQSITFNDAIRIPTGAYGLAFYDSNKTLMGSGQQTSRTYVGIAGGAYTRVSIDKNKINTASGNYGAVLYEQEQINPELLPLISNEPLYNVSALRETKKRLQNIKLGVYTDKLKISFIGDSWTHAAKWYSLHVNNLLKTEYGNGGIGWTGFGWLPYGNPLPRPSGLNGNIDSTVVDVALNGSWTQAYSSQTSPDLATAISATTGDNIVVTTTRGTGPAILFARSSDSGVVRYNFNGGAWTAVNLNDSTDRYSLTVPNFSAFTLTIEVVSGTCKLDGLLCSSTTQGVACDKLGATGSQAAQWGPITLTTRWRNNLAALAPNLVCVLLGTNDGGAGRTKSQFKNDIQNIVASIKAAVPIADIMLISPPKNGAGQPVSMSVYAEAMREIAITENIAHLNLQNHYGENYADYGYGSTRGWFAADNIHPTDNGGAIANTSAILQAIL